MKAMKFIGAVSALLAVVAVSLAQDKPAAPQSGVAAATPLEQIKKLVGKWASDKPGPNGMPAPSVEFKLTSGGSAVMETMMGGTPHEMVNLYTMDGNELVMTHYCGMGNQPHMKLGSSDKGVLKFEFVRGGNLKSRDEPHMDSLTLTVSGDTILEEWSFYQDGKVSHTEVFTMRRK